MCGIIGLFNHPDAGAAVLKGLNILKERGRDGYGVTDGEHLVFEKQLDRLAELPTKACLGHCLHSLVGFVPQPIPGKKGFIAANCEIYNWKQLCTKYGFRAENDAELLLKLVEMKSIGDSSLAELEGVYAFAYWHGNEVVLARDILGIKPLWYSLSKGLAFASEKKALVALGCRQIAELNPREIMRYSIAENSASFEQRQFFSLEPLNRRSHQEIIADVENLLVEAVRKRLPSDRFGILFSGGIDSSTLALICKALRRQFTCYTAVLDEPQLVADDLAFAEKAAAEYGFELKVKKIRLEEVESYIKRVAPLIEDSNVVKIGVALTFYAACELAKEDGIRVMFSGLGSEEIFAGYQRHKQSADINKECLSGLLKIYERDTYRDDVVTMNNNIELRLPYLDLKLVEYALRLPPLLKLDGDKDKVVLRLVAKQLGLRHEFADRKKKAAQYGSRFDKAIEKLARRERKLKSEYLKAYYTPPNLRLGVLFSSGKDSAYAMYLMQRQNYEITCLITVRSQNKASYMFHTPNVGLVRLQAEAMGIPLVEQVSKGIKEQELDDLEQAISLAKKKYNIEGVVTGALFSEYQRSRIEKVCDRIGLKIFSPLWHMDQELELRQIVAAGFEVVLSSIAAFGLDQSWLGKKIDNNFVDNLKTIHNMYKINIAGEGGEYESLVLDGPMFKKRIVVEESEVEVEDSSTARMVVVKAMLTEKQLPINR